MHIVIVGAGQIGSRHLQALITTKVKIEISIIDPSHSSLEKTKVRWEEVGGKHSSFLIKYYNSVSNLSKDIDLALITTSSFNRLEIIKELAKSVKVKYWILEKVLAQSETDIDEIKYLTSNSLNCWVNNPRRVMKWHKEIRLRLLGKGPYEINYSGRDWGLACNSVHFIDLAMWWADENIQRIDTSNLDKNWFEAKRKGYFEVNGKLSILFSNGSRLKLVSNSNIKKNLLTVNLSNGEKWKIDENVGKAFSSKKEILNGTYEPQSSMTGKLIDKIYKNGKCDLPDINESSKVHKPFIREMLNHWNKSNNTDHKLIPIT